MKEWREPVGKISGKYYFFGEHDVERTFFNTGTLITGNHRHNDLGRIRYDSGGPFLLTKEEWSIDPADVVRTETGAVRYRGQVLPGLPVGFTGLSSFAKKSDLALDADGTTAIARCEPTAPHAQFLTAMGEVALDGGVPSASSRSVDHFLWEESTGRARAAGRDYLNVKFGWLPLVNDVKQFARAVVNRHEIMHNYLKNSDRKIKRRYIFPTKSDHYSKSGTIFPVPSEYDDFGQGSVDQYILQDSWFSGAFIYHVPVGDSVLGRLKQYHSLAQNLLGVDLTPEVLWNLAPWSWAADWQANIGDVMHNISALGHDGLVMQYGYQMCKSTFEEYRYGVFLGSSCTTAYKSKTLQRRPATPYGFGVDFAALSAQQISIVVALGLTRQSRI